MRKYQFTHFQRAALWEAHGKRCAYCRESLRFIDLTIDHILPEAVARNPSELASLTVEYGLFADFSVNSYLNWLPVCGSCNTRKGADILDKSKACILLHIAQKKAVEAAACEARLRRRERNDDAVSRTALALEDGLLTVDELQTLIATHLGRNERLRDSPAYNLKCQLENPYVITFGLTVSDVLVDRTLPRGVPRSYPRLCDWLTRDLARRIDQAFTASDYYFLEDARSGESLSVRFAVWSIGPSELEAVSDPWWTILEVDRYVSLYEPDAWDFCELCESRRPTEIIWCSDDSNESSFVTSGWCDSCDGLHVKCACCGTIIGIRDEQYGEKIECPCGCGLQLVAHQGRKGRKEYIQILRGPTGLSATVGQFREPDQLALPYQPETN
jgi:hypothetical protein